MRLIYGHQRQLRLRHLGRALDQARRPVDRVSAGDHGPVGERRRVLHAHQPVALPAAQRHDRHGLQRRLLQRRAGDHRPGGVRRRVRRPVAALREELQRTKSARNADAEEIESLRQWNHTLSHEVEEERRKNEALNNEADAGLAEVRFLPTTPQLSSVTLMLQIRRFI